MTVNQTARRKSAQRWGVWGEWIAAAYLCFKGYRIVQLRYKTKLGEVDLIARKRDLVAMVEVKVRPTIEQAVDAVTPASQRRISDAGDIWFSKQKDAARLSIRYDIIAIRPWKKPVHFKDAF